MMDFNNVQSLVIPQGEVATIARDAEILWRKKKYKCEVEYLESTGTQYIDTGIVGTLDTAYEIDMSTEATGFLMILFGSRSSATSNVVSTIVRQDTNQIVNDFGNYKQTRHQFNGTVKSNGRYKIYNSKNKRFTYDYSTGETQTSTAAFSGTLATPTNLYIAYKSAGFLDNHYNFEGKIYCCKIWQGENLIRDFIPVLDWNDRPCMYDRVTDELFYNQGMGKFLYG